MGSESVGRPSDEFGRSEGGLRQRGLTSVRKGTMIDYTIHLITVVEAPVFLPNTIWLVQSSGENNSLAHNTSDAQSWPSQQTDTFACFSRNQQNPIKIDPCRRKPIIISRQLPYLHVVLLRNEACPRSCRAHKCLPERAPDGGNREHPPNVRSSKRLIADLV